MSFAFHAAPPTGEWLNDPNGLIFAEGRYRLFAQHACDTPAFKAIGWARFSSDDLLDWTFDGPVIPPDQGIWAYSGSIPKVDARLDAFLTRHDSTVSPPVQSQARATSTDGGLTWQIEGGPAGPSGRNVRDPFVWFCNATSDWRMLVAEPCDWHDWAIEPASTLAVWSSPDCDSWTSAGRMESWLPPGVMWEVPVLIDFGERQALMISTVDRRDDQALCGARYWIGRFDGAEFVAETANEGLPLDLGPDFYAACVNTQQGWPNDERVLLGWASGWATARAAQYTGSGHGGPISLPRIVTLVGDRLALMPVRSAVPALHLAWNGASLHAFQIPGGDTALRIELHPGGGRVARSGAAPWHWSQPFAFDFAGVPQMIEIYEDNGLLEIFLHPSGLSITAFVREARIDSMLVDDEGSFRRG